MNISAYPDFQPIDKGQKPLFDEMFKRDVPEISEFTFTNLYAWRDIHHINVSVIDGMLLLRMGAGGEGGFLDLIGSGDKKRAMVSVMEDTAQAFVRVPEKTAGMFSGEKNVSVTLTRDHSDYLYIAKDLVELSGKKYDGKRNLIKKFRTEHEYEYERLDGKNISDYYHLENEWCSIKGCDEIKGLDNERKAAREMADNFSYSGLFGGLIRTGGKACAVVIAEYLNKDTIVIHIFKADPESKGAYQTMFNEFLLHESGGCTYVNMEQDLGVEGLRKAKLSYHPVKIIPKYTITSSLSS